MTPTGSEAVVTPEQLAEARKDLGRQLAAWRKAAGYTQVSFASPNGPAGYSRSAIANVETGRENMPRSFWEMCDRRLGAGGALLAAHDRVDELVRRHRQQRTLRPGGPAPGGPAPASGEEDPVGRERVASYEALERSVAIRSKLARARPSEGGWLHGKVDDLVDAHRNRHRAADIPLLRKAYDTAERRHRGQTRRSGEPYLTHPVTVAHTIAELGLDTTVVVAALLHDLVEDAAFTVADVRADFGEAVATLVDGVRELDRIYLEAAAGTESADEACRKMLHTARSDVRALVVKIAYRLHHMRTLRFRHPPSQVHTATVTRDIVIPLADRLGLAAIRRELEDLVLATVEPEIYERIHDHLSRVEPGRRAQVATAQRLLSHGLRRAHIRAEVHDQPRHHYSVYREMVKHPQSGPHHPPQLVVVITGGSLDCYRTLGAVHRIWRPVPGSFTDLIAAPKPNAYQSLHTTVVGPADEHMQVLVRTRRMHRVAETGVTADRSERAASSVGPRQLGWLDQLLTWQQEADEPEHLIELPSEPTIDRRRAYEAAR